MKPTPVVTILICAILVAFVATSIVALSRPAEVEAAEPVETDDLRAFIEHTVRTSIGQEMTSVAERVDFVETIAKDAASIASRAAAATTPKPVDARATIVRNRVDGQDLADLLDLKIWRFEFTLPENRYTAFVWIERWEKGFDEPDVELLASGSAVWSSGDLIVKLPTDPDRRLFIRVGDASVSRASEATPVSPPTPIGLASLDATDLELGRAVHLITMSHNRIDRPVAQLVDAHLDHDLAVYVKVGFIPGAAVPFDPAAWVPALGPISAPADAPANPNADPLGADSEPF